MVVSVGQQEHRRAAVAGLHRAPGVHHTMLVAVATVEQDTEIHRIDLAGLVGAHRDTVVVVEVKGDHTTAVGDMGKVHHTIVGEDIDPEGPCYDVVDLEEDLEEVRHMAADFVAGNLGVADSSSETDHNPEGGQEEHHVAVGTLAAGIGLMEVAHSPAEEGLGDCQH